MTGQITTKFAAASVAAALAALLSVPALAQDLWINEFHYDNGGGDVGEFVEVVVADSVATAPANLSIVLYNGSNGTDYATHTLDTFTATSVPGFTIYDKAISGIQNGGPDGLALIDSAAVVQFLSYEGSFTATSGPASGQTSVDIGVAEDGGTAIGESLQLTGPGSSYADFTWQAPAAETPGAVNNGQTLTAQTTLPLLNEIDVTNQFIEIVGEPGTDLSDLDFLVIDAAGSVLRHFDLSDSIQADGYWLGGGFGLFAAYGVDAADVEQNLSWSGEPAPVTYFLVQGFSGAVNDDLDTDDDGSLDSTPWAASASDVAFSQNGNAVQVYSDNLFNRPTFAGAFLCPDETGAWVGMQSSPGDGTPGQPNNCVGRIPPSVTAVDPADGATAVPVGTTLTIDFDRSVDATVDAVTLDCGGPVSFSGLPQTGVAQLVITPDSDLPLNVECFAAVIADEVTNAAGDSMAGDVDWAFRTELGALEIYEIQGSGAASAFDGQVVTTEGNVVTALAPNGFFIQTPDARADGDVDTSDGIFVFTNTAPAVALGDLVDVTGEVVEFFDFTEFTNGPTVTVVGTGPLPTPVTFDANVPSSNRMAPSCAIEFECYEGMRVSMPEGIIGSGNQEFGSEPLAEVSVKAGGLRNLREPGIEFPGQPGLPTWDGNPEVFEISPAALGLPELALFGGTRVQAEGVLAFSFGDYELWPSTLTILDAPTLPGAVAPPAAGDVAIGSINVLRLFDDVDDPGTDDPIVDPAVYAERLDRFADHIVNAMRAPAVIAFQEVESAGVLQDLAAEIAGLDPSLVYSAELIEGNDVGGIDVGYLVRDDVTVLNVDQLGENEILSFDGSLLHDRPPLLLQVRFTDGPDTLDVNLLAVHNRSLRDIDDTSSVGQRVRTKRLEQAQSIGQMVQDLQTAQPDAPLIVLGDFNAFEFSDGYVDLTGQIAGTAIDADNDFWAPPIPSPGLHVATLSLPPQERYSFVFQGTAQALDHALYSEAAAPHFLAMAYTRGSADAPEVFNEMPAAGEEDLGVSDHDSFVIQLSIIAELLFADGFESN